MAHIGFLRARALAAELHGILGRGVIKTVDDQQVRELVQSILRATDGAYPVNDAAARLLRSLDGQEVNRAGEPLTPGQASGILVVAVEAARTAFETGEPVPGRDEPLFGSTITPEEAAVHPQVISIETLRSKRNRG